MDISHLSLSVGIFTGLLFFQNSPNILEEKKLSKSVFGYFMNKKNPTAAIKPEEGGGVRP